MNAPMISPGDYLRLRAPQAGVLYYPGCGTDWGPLHLFGSHQQITAAIYVDYAIEREAARRLLTVIPGWDVVAEPEDLTPDYLRVEAWDRCWPDSSEALRVARPGSAFGLASRVGNGSANVEFVFLATEATQTFSLLHQRDLATSIVVLQDHVFGCNWSPFGGESLLYQAARDSAHLPDLLFVAHSTDPWPGYRQVSEYAVLDGQQHDHARALFARDVRHDDR